MRAPRWVVVAPAINRNAAGAHALIKPQPSQAPEDKIFSPKYPFMDGIQRNTLVEIVSQSFAVETVDYRA